MALEDYLRERVWENLGPEKQQRVLKRFARSNDLAGNLFPASSLYEVGDRASDFFNGDHFNPSLSFVYISLLYEDNKFKDSCMSINSFERLGKFSNDSPIIHPELICETYGSNRRTPDNFVIDDFVAFASPLTGFSMDTDGDNPEDSKRKEKKYGVLMVARDKRFPFALSERMVMGEAARFIGHSLANVYNVKLDRGCVTGVYSRKEFNQSLNDKIRNAGYYGHPICLIYFDLDHFKEVNDTKGHGVGDKALQVFADTVNFYSAKYGLGHFYRIGGEEFALVTERKSVTDVYEFAESIRKAVAELKFNPNHANDREFGISVSIGIADYRDGDNSESFKNRADEALYSSKTNGRNRVSLP